jgi:hypothetical protein
MQAVGQDVFGSVGEAVIGPAGDDASMEQVGEVAVPGDLSKADDDTDTRECGDFGSEVFRTVSDLLGERLVSGWSAAYDRGDPGVAEF